LQVETLTTAKLVSLITRPPAGHDSMVEGIKINRSLAARFEILFLEDRRLFNIAAPGEVSEFFSLYLSYEDNRRLYWKLLLAQLKIYSVLVSELARRKGSSSAETTCILRVPASMTVAQRAQHARLQSRLRHMRSYIAMAERFHFISASVRLPAAEGAFDKLSYLRGSRGLSSLGQRVLCLSHALNCLIQSLSVYDPDKLPQGALGVEIDSELTEIINLGAAVVDCSISAVEAEFALAQERVDLILLVIEGLSRSQALLESPAPGLS
jgi:hypothetical protein